MTRRIAALALGATALTLVSAVPAQASQWDDYRGEDFSYAPNDVCAFGIDAHITSDKERYRTTETYPDGSPKLQQFTGQLVIAYTNTATGQTVSRNLTGRGDFRYFPDGGESLTDQGGSFAVGMHQGDNPAPGLFVFTGKGWVVTIDADGHKALTAGTGTIEDLCRTLG